MRNWQTRAHTHTHQLYTHHKSNTSTCYTTLKLCNATQRQITRQLKYTDTHTSLSLYTQYIEITFSAFLFSQYVFLLNIDVLICTQSRKFREIISLYVYFTCWTFLSLSQQIEYFIEEYSIYTHTHTLDTKIQIHLNNHLNLIFC